MRSPPDLWRGHNVLFREQCDWKYMGHTSGAAAGLSSVGFVLGKVPIAGTWNIHIVSLECL